MSVSAVERLLAAEGATAIARDGDALRARVHPGEMRVLAAALAALGLELQLFTAADTRAISGDFTLVYVFAAPTHRPSLTLLAPLSPHDPRVPSLAMQSFAASLFERDVHDLFGIVPDGHPDPRRLALHQFWPAGYHPLRRDVASRVDFRDEGQPFPFRRIFEITVGPVHAGIIEPGHFRFSVEGETIVNLEARLGFVHKGIEKLFETLPLAKTCELAERISGDTSVGHTLAHCRGLEALAGCAVPPRALALRAVLLELERLYNHVGDIGMILNDTGFAFGHAHCFRLREELLRLNERLTGHRLLRGVVVPGGIAGVSTTPPADLARNVDRLVREFADVATLSLDNTMVLERLQGTGRLTTRAASIPMPDATRRSLRTTRSTCRSPSTTPAMCGRARCCASTRPESLRVSSRCSFVRCRTVRRTYPSARCALASTPRSSWRAGAVRSGIGSSRRDPRRWRA